MSQVFLPCCCLGWVVASALNQVADVGNVYLVHGDGISTGVESGECETMDRTSNIGIAKGSPDEVDYFLPATKRTTVDEPVYAGQEEAIKATRHEQQVGLPGPGQVILYEEEDLIGEVGCHCRCRVEAYHLA